MKKFNEPRLGLKIRHFRDAIGLSQDDLAKTLGVNDRQTVSDIERGNRRVSAEELLKLSSLFGVSMEHLTNPFLLGCDKASFSWRQSGVAAADLTQFEARAGEWIGAFRELRELNGEPLRTILPRLSLTHKSSFEDAVAAGDAVASELELGLKPAARLAEVMENKLGILVLMVDAITGVSGAACRLPQLNTVLINRRETEARRSFDLAHELFHILTWDTMPPQRIDPDTSIMDGVHGTNRMNASEKRVHRVEQLANNFASGLLMPNAVVEKLNAVLDKMKPSHQNLAAWISSSAHDLGVSKQALKFRLINAGSLSRQAVDECDFSIVPKDRIEPSLPLAFSETFVKTIALAIEGGHLSGRRAAALLDTTTDELGELCEAYKIERPLEL